MKRWIFRLFIGLIGLLLIGFGIGYTPEYPRGEALKKYANVESEFIEIAPGTKIHVRDQGDSASPAMILIHGSNASLHTWEAWVSHLKSDYRIITLDLPGHGLTGAGGSTDYSVAGQVEVVNKIMAAKNIPTAIIGGNSMGGNVSWAFALAHPGKVRALLLVDAGGLHNLRRATNAKKPSGNLGFNLARNPIAGFLMTKITPRALVEKSFRQSVADPKIATPEMVDRYWELLRYDGNRAATMMRFKGYAAQLKQQAPSLSAITAPTLILWGREDNLINVASAETFRQQIANSDIIIYDRVGHIPMEEIPARSAADVRRWLATLQLK
jgi:pimeloyl-ACP methyl ester carboxylesterase